MPIIRIVIAVLFLLVAASELTACGKNGDLEPPPTKKEIKNKEETKKKSG